VRVIFAVVECVSKERKSGDWLILFGGAWETSIKCALEIEKG
jgi:hypothetical protein